MAYNEVSKKATNTYRSKFDIIQIRVPQGSRRTNQQTCQQLRRIYKCLYQSCNYRNDNS